MKIILKFLIIALVVVALSSFAILPCAAEGQVDVFYDISKEDAEALMETLAVRVISEPEKTGDFTGFAVAENGDFALCFYEGDHETILGRFTGGKDTFDMILVYDSDGVYKYGLGFTAYGEIGATFNPDNTLVLYLTRSECAISIDSEGNCFDFKQVESRYPLSHYWIGSEKKAGDVAYTARHWRSDNVRTRNEYQRLVKIMPTGEEITVFQANNHITNDDLQMIVGPLVALLCFAAAGIIVPSIIRRKRKKRAGKSSP